MKPREDVLRRLLEDEEYKKAKDAFMRYLAAYKVIEQNLSLFDKMARCRDAGDFILAVYESIRVKDRILDRLVEEVKDGRIGVVFEYKSADELKKIFSVGQDHIEKLVELAREDPRVVGSFISASALAYAGLYEKGR
jgi:predicted metal-dependent phosphoesterase TrpH